MKLEKVELDETECFSPIFLDYIRQEEKLKPFYRSFPLIENFGELIRSRAFPDEKRQALVDALATQYGPFETPEAVEFNIHSLNNAKTFTVTTGHQLNVFTGPLYFIYKLVTTINACRELAAAYPEYNFVPVYWMASEDHDLAEINHFNLFGKKYQWETKQKGPVGRFNPHTLNDLIGQLPEKVELFEQAYLDHNHLADAVRFYVNALFGEHGLVVIDGDQKELKELFVPVIEGDLFENRSNELVEANGKKLEAAGYKSQAFSREINFFYQEDGLRERIVREGTGFRVLNTEAVFTEDEFRSLLHRHPQSFSPNVIMRPLYQETILPNLAYIGGPAEVAYWLQLKEVFEYHQVFFPVLMPRNFCMVVNKATRKKMEKIGLTTKDVFKSGSQLKEEYLRKYGQNGYGLEQEKNELARVFGLISAKAETIDKSLVGFVGAEGSKSFKSLEHIAKRLKKAEEQNNETALSQIDAIKEKLFPGGTLQERHDNFLNFYLNHPGFVDELLELFDPFDYRFHVLQDA